MAFNIAILVTSGVAAYFLAGRTLKPIEKMVDEQKQFISNASHELRTPLTSMRTEIEVALREQNLSSENAQDVLISNLEEIEKLQVLSDRLLVLGRLQNQDADNDLEIVDVVLLGEEAIGKVLPMANAKEIRISYEFTGANIEAQKDKILDLLVIFLENAIK
ncbi:MAG: hypothetical protein HY779_02955 [Rubrobacteridae bacterium]|nr:hypothetical protein [Rubrobacteridae bacterium]